MDTSGGKILAGCRSQAVAIMGAQHGGHLLSLYVVHQKEGGGVGKVRAEMLLYPTGGLGG